MQWKVMTIALCTVLCLGCSTTVRVINFKETEFYTQKKDDVTFYCMSDYYVKEVLKAKIQEVDPK